MLRSVLNEDGSLPLACMRDREQVGGKEWWRMVGRFEAMWGEKVGRKVEVEDLCKEVFSDPWSMFS